MKKRKRKPREFGASPVAAQDPAAVLGRYTAENALADQFKQLPTNLRLPSLNAVYRRCNQSEREQLLLYRLAELRGGARSARKSLALRCLRVLHADDPVAMRGWVSEVQGGAEAPAAQTQAAGSRLGSRCPTNAVGKSKIPAGRSNIAADKSKTGTDTGIDTGTSTEEVVGVAVETQTPTGLVQLLLADTFAVPPPSQPPPPPPPPLPLPPPLPQLPPLLAATAVQTKPMVITASATSATPTAATTTDSYTFTEQSMGLLTDGATQTQALFGEGYDGDDDLTATIEWGEAATQTTQFTAMPLGHTHSTQTDTDVITAMAIGTSTVDGVDTLLDSPGLRVQSIGTSPIPF